jgi:hypothetical protein
MDGPHRCPQGFSETHLPIAKQGESDGSRIGGAFEGGGKHIEATEGGDAEGVRKKTEGWRAYDGCARKIAER